MNRILVIQTSFIGDVILATSVVEKLHQFYPSASIDFLVRKGNEALLDGHPFLNRVWVWDKQSGKYSNLLKLSREIKAQSYDLVVNVHRFAASGYLTWTSQAKERSGFAKNPFSFSYTRKVKHEIGNGKHEIERNQELIQPWTDEKPLPPRLYPTEKHVQKVQAYQNDPYVVIAPASVWFTKQLPTEKWAELIASLNPDLKVHFIGAPQDRDTAQVIIDRAGIEDRAINLAGELSLMESTALMQKATMNYVNDSAPLHLASSVDAPVTAFFCSTVPRFGFGPSGTQGKVAETEEKLDCRPCGLHGKKECPQQHFKCATTLPVKKFAV
ncbi:glycosyltransferase family 9 protein [bacterium SCSIO 12741]|nr:glycosyltransferase family 9 protein [bacterium SCSIO 12741]